MRIFKFLLLILLIAPINAFGACEYETENDCNNYFSDGCYWKPGYEDPVAGLVPPSCATCGPRGYIETTDGKKSCESCPAGYYCTGDGQKTQCPAGTYNDKMNSVSDAACTPCPAGEYSGSDGADHCDTCPPGYYCVDGFKNPCPAGTYSAAAGLTTSAECTPCENGTYNAETGRTIECEAQCKKPIQDDLWLGNNYSFDFTSGGYSPDSCQWWFRCDAKNVYPVCDATDGCRCVSCGNPYEASSVEREKTIIFNGEDFVPDPDSVRPCPEFSPLPLRSDPITPVRPAGNVGTFFFYAIIRDGNVFISAKNDPEPANYGNEIEIQNVALSDGVNYDVTLSIGNCKFETIGCGSARNTYCTVKVSSDACRAADLKSAAGNSSTEKQLKTIWNLDIPVLIAQAEMIFDNKNVNNELHIIYNNKSYCYKWYKNPGQIETWNNNGNPIINRYSSCDVEINGSRDRYNKVDASLPFLGYTIGCWWKDAGAATGRPGLNGMFIMLDDDFIYPSDCSKQSALPKDPNTAVTASVQNRVWPGVSGSYTYEKVNSTLADTNVNDVDKRCFIVGLYSYPPCSPGCYCQGGNSTECAPSHPFTSDRGSDARTDCYPKSDVVFKEGDNDVTDRVKGYFQYNVGSYKDIYLVQ